MSDRNNKPRLWRLETERFGPKGVAKPLLVKVDVPHNPPNCLWSMYDDLTDRQTDDDYSPLFASVTKNLQIIGLPIPSSTVEGPGSSNGPSTLVRSTLAPSLLPHRRSRSDRLGTPTTPRVLPYLLHPQSSRMRTGRYGKKRPLTPLDHGGTTDGPRSHYLRM